MSLPRERHDALFRLLISDPRYAADLLQDYLPPEFASRLDPARPPELVEGASVDGDGAATRMDALFRVWIRGGGAVYVLLEHKSYFDQKTPVQIMNYTLTLYKVSKGRNEVPHGKLPLVIPLVFYHGKGPWNVPLSIEDMIHVPPALEGIDVSFGDYKIVDLVRIDPPNHLRSVVVRAVLLALARSRADTIPEDEVEFLVAGIDDTELGRYFLTYVIRQLELPRERLMAALDRLGVEARDKKAMVGTIAEQILEEGRMEGRVEGEAKGRMEGRVEGRVEGLKEGKAVSFLRLARLKFGEIPPGRVEQVRGAANGELDIWLDALFSAEDLDAVFAARSIH